MSMPVVGILSMIISIIIVTKPVGTASADLVCLEHNVSTKRVGGQYVS